jgi:folate-binding Fe-S cluster repair protein YgfZ
VHLAKGCYRGQEAVARVHNLGQPPRRIVFLHLDGSGHLVPPAGAEVRAEVRGQLRAVGHVTTSALHWELGPVALAVIKRSVDPEATLHVVVRGAEGNDTPAEAARTDADRTDSQPGGSAGPAEPEELVVAAQEPIVVTKREPSGPQVQRNREVDQRRR